MISAIRMPVTPNTENGTCHPPDHKQSGPDYRPQQRTQAEERLQHAHEGPAALGEIAAQARINRAYLQASPAPVMVR